MNAGFQFSSVEIAVKSASVIPAAKGCYSRARRKKMRVMDEMAELISVGEDENLGTLKCEKLTPGTLSLSSYRI
jgi:hypothetical protein